MIVDHKRIQVIDSLRGFAIFCILLLHCSNHFLYDAMPEYNVAWLRALDSSTKETLYFLLEGKAFGIFAILFGFTFGVQYFKAQERGDDFRARFLWRMVLLAVFGGLNAAFFAGGDPLVFMAIVSLILPIVARLSTKIQLGIALVLFLQPVEIYKAIDLWVSMDDQTANRTGALYAMLKPYVEKGDFIPMVWANLTIGLEACLTWAWEYGRVSQTPALYIVGFILYRHALFTNIHSQFWTKLFVCSAIATPLFYLLKSMPTPHEPLQIATGMWYNLAFIFLWVAGFTILFRDDFFKRLTYLFQIYGKMSLTNFVSQSVIATVLFYPYGLHLSIHCGVFYSVLIGVGIAVVQIILSCWWLNRFKQGPLESLWHRATNFNFGCRVAADPAQR